MNNMPFRKTGKEDMLDWAYIMTEDYTFNLGKSYKIPREFKNEWMWLRMENDETLLTIFKDYAWDGPTAVYDFEGTILGSLPHDALYQFCEDIAKVFGWSWVSVIWMADSIFKLAMTQQKTNVVVKYVYFAGVAIVGVPFHYIAKLFK